MTPKARAAWYLTLSAGGLVSWLAYGALWALGQNPWPVFALGLVLLFAASGWVPRPIDFRSLVAAGELQGWPARGAQVIAALLYAGALAFLLLLLVGAVRN